MKKIYSFFQSANAQKIMTVAFMILASFCTLTSCGNDDDTKSDSGNGDSGKSDNTQTVTFTSHVSISQQVKDMMKLHYYVVESNGDEKEVNEIPDKNETYSKNGSYLWGYKIATEIKRDTANNETVEDYKARFKKAVADYVDNNKIDCATFDFKISISSIYMTGESIGNKYTTSVGSIADALKLYPDEDAKKLLQDMAYEFIKEDIVYAHNFTITDTSYQWPKYQFKKY